MSVRKHRLGLYCITAAVIVGVGVSLLSQLWGAAPRERSQDDQQASRSGTQEPSDKQNQTPPEPTLLTGVSGFPVLDIPVGTKGRPILVPISVPPNGDVQFLLDTGAAVTVFDESLKPGNIRPIDRLTFTTSGGMLELDVYPCPVAKLGQVDLTIIPVIAYEDLASMRAATGTEIRGILGMDFLEHFAMEIDFDLGRFQLWNTAPAEWARDEPLLLNRKYGVRYVEVLLPEHRSESFLVDTGANVSTVREQVFDVLETEGQLTPFGTGFASTAAGSIRQTKAILSQMKLAQWEHSHLRIDRDLTNTIGLAYLSRYRLRIDLSRDRMYLQPSARFDLPDRTATCGMAVAHVEGRKVIVHIEPFGPAEAVRLLPGDVIESIDGEAISQMDMFDVGALLTSRSDVALQIAVARGDRRWEVTLHPVSRIGTPE